ncbi:MAG: type I methionyl aminopeptidase [Chloroflexi bacterium]|nr:type I methionyl aminopeptidase [Chloroflexota bacterium]
MIYLKRPEEIASMRAAGRIVAEILAELGKRIEPGMRTLDIELVATGILKARGAQSPFMHYPHHGNGPAFPANVCVSVNEELVHGIPGRRVLKEGDVVSVDCGAVVDGWVGDGAWTFPVGKVSPVARKLLDVTRDALLLGIQAARGGGRIGDIGHAVETHVRSNGFAVIRDYVGHGVGRSMHEEPQVPNYGTPGRGARLQPGMTFALEPMVSVGSPKTRELRDGWTVVIADKSLSAQFEHTIAIGDGEAQVLTQL